MGKLKTLWTGVRSSLWFVPALSILAAVALALGLVELDTHAGLNLRENFPRLFGVSADGARAMLSGIASSMITVAGVTFSITIVSLSLAATQYTPRVLRNFMRDPGNQIALGSLVGIFVYCLIVLRTIHGGEDPFIPASAVGFSILLGVFGIGMFIYFIHHIASTIQASSILSSIARETIVAVEGLFPEKLGEPRESAEPPDPRALTREISWTPIPAEESGFIQKVEPGSLLQCATRHKMVIRMEHGIGDFVTRGTPLVSISEGDADEQTLRRELNRLFGFQSYRSIEQDPAFGIRQIVDIALKAISPGINDPTTAVICLNYLGTILHALLQRRIPSRYRFEKGQLRVIACGPSFEDLTDAMFAEIRQSSRDCVSVMQGMLRTIDYAARECPRGERHRHLLEHSRLIGEHARAFLKTTHDLKQIEEQVTKIRGVFP